MTEVLAFFNQQNPQLRRLESPQVLSSRQTWKPEPQRPPAHWLSQTPSSLSQPPWESGFLLHPAWPWRRDPVIPKTFFSDSNEQSSVWASFPCLRWSSEMPKRENSRQNYAFPPPLALLGEMWRTALPASIATVHFLLSILTIAITYLRLVLRISDLEWI